MPRLILASTSPRRQELLRQAGFSFTVVPAPGVEEPYRSGEPPTAYAERMALRKAEEGARRCREGSVVVLGADTVVEREGKLLGKPASAAEAESMLQELSGRVHRVITGVALTRPGSPRRSVAHEITRVYFRPLTREEIRDYVATGEPLDKAGAYAVQGRAARFVTRIEGCYFNVVGLPVALVDRLLREWEQA